MAKTFKPSFPYTTAFELQIPTTTIIKGVTTKTFQALETPLILNCSFKTYGGTETTVNDVYVIEDTAKVETWYRPDIQADCRIKILATGKVYEIISEPENIDMRNQFCAFRVRAINGKA